ncbi:hypothetical protein Hanom_Chr10g00889091 [Helianthus anomalus]
MSFIHLHILTSGSTDLVVNELCSDGFSVSTVVHAAQKHQPGLFGPLACSNPLLDPEPMNTISSIPHLLLS